MVKTNINIFWKIFIPFVLMFLVGTSGWTVVRVADLPREYETKADHKDDVNKLDKQMEELQSKILTQQGNIESKVDEINKFLRDYFSKH